MSKISFEEARVRAVDAINHLARREQLGDLTIIDAAIVETESAWYFPYDAVDFIVNGNVSTALAGNVPIKVPKDGGATTYEAPIARH